VSRLAATLRLDARLQARNRVYLIIAVAALALALPLRALFSPGQLHFFMPLVALSGVGITTFFLVGILLMLERGEGTLDVVLVSPLRPVEYLASKLLTVIGAALVEAALLTGVAYGPGFSLPRLALAVLLRAGLVGAAGVILGVRYRSITDFLLPAATPWQWIGSVPAPLYYPMRLLWGAADGRTEWWLVVPGLLLQGAMLVWLARRFGRAVYA
jgi:fluoroquinolone transport system permease protein